MRVEVGKIFCRRDVGNLPFTAHLNDCRSDDWPLLHVCALAVPFALMFASTIPHVKRSLIGQ